MSNAIELVIDEPTAGHFYWTLVTLDGRYGLLKAVDWAAGPLPSRKTATDAGLIALHLHRDARARTEELLQRFRLHKRNSAGPATTIQ